MIADTVEYHTTFGNIHALLDQSASLQNSEPQQAADLAGQALRLIDSLNGLSDTTEARILRSRALMMFGMGHARLGKYRESMPYLEEALDIARTAADPTAITNALISVAYVYRFLSDYAQAKENYEQAVDYAKDAGNIQLEARALTGLGVLCHSQGDYICALSKFSDALRQQEKIGDELGMCYTLQNIGGIYSAFFDFTAAQEYFNQALEKWRKLGNRHGEAMTLNNLALIFRDMGNLDGAQEIFRQCIRIQEEIGDINSKALALMNLATVYGHKEQFDEAISCYLQALDMQRTTGNRFAEGSTMLNLGRAYLSSGQTDQAYGYLIPALELITSLNAKRNYPPLFGCLAELAIERSELFKSFKWEKFAIPKEKEWHPAEAFLHEAYAISKEMSAKYEQSNTAHIFATLYKKQGKHELAMKYFEEYIRLEKEIFNEESDQRNKILMIRFETERAHKEAEILRLQNEKLAQDMEHRKQELDSMTLYLVQKNQALSSVRKLASEAVRAKADAKKKLLQQILRLTNSGGESFWQHFDERFRMVHGDFTDRLARKFPDLTPMEMRICVLVKAGLSSKEVAEILSISERTAENHRTNVRKKLDLSRTANLTSYLSGF